MLAGMRFCEMMSWSDFFIAVLISYWFGDEPGHDRSLADL